MDPDSVQTQAEGFLDRAAEKAQGDGIPLEVLAQIGIGYAVLALVDEIDLLRRELRAREP